MDALQEGQQYELSSSTVLLKTILSGTGQGLVQDITTGMFSVCNLKDLKYVESSSTDAPIQVESEAPVQVVVEVVIDAAEENANSIIDKDIDMLASEVTSKDPLQLRVIRRHLKTLTLAHLNALIEYLIDDRSEELNDAANPKYELAKQQAYRRRNIKVGLPLYNQWASQFGPERMASVLKNEIESFGIPAPPLKLQKALNRLRQHMAAFAGLHGKLPLNPADLAATIKLIRGDSELSESIWRNFFINLSPVAREPAIMPEMPTVRQRLYIQIGNQYVVGGFGVTNWDPLRPICFVTDGPKKVYDVLLKAIARYLNVSNFVVETPRQLSMDFFRGITSHLPQRGAIVAEKKITNARTKTKAAKKALQKFVDPEDPKAAKAAKAVEVAEAAEAAILAEQVVPIMLYTKEEDKQDFDDMDEEDTYVSRSKNVQNILKYYGVVMSSTSLFKETNYIYAGNRFAPGPQGPRFNLITCETNSMQFLPLRHPLARAEEANPFLNPTDPILLTYSTPSAIFDPVTIDSVRDKTGKETDLILAYPFDTHDPRYTICFIIVRHVIGDTYDRIGGVLVYPKNYARKEETQTKRKRLGARICNSCHIVAAKVACSLCKTAVYCGEACAARDQKHLCAK
jgi:hypothetical protein